MNYTEKEPDCYYGRYENDDAYYAICEISDIDPFDCPRFRSWDVSFERPVLTIRGRCGGGNRENYEDEIENMEEDKNFIESHDDDMDSTYMYFTYTLSEDEWKDFCNKYRETKKERAERYERNKKREEEEKIREKNKEAYNILKNCSRWDEKTQELCDDAFKYNPEIFYKIPEEFKTQDMCDLFVRGYIYSINEFNLIPEKYITPKICINYSIRGSLGYGIDYIPKQHITQKLCDEYFEHYNKKNIDVISKIPKKYISEKIMNEIIYNQKKYWCMKYIPEKFITQKMCDMCVNEQPSYNVFENIPEKYKNKELCDKIISNGKRGGKYGRESYLELIPEKFITQEMCDTAIKKYSNIFKSVPDKFKTSDMCIYAIKRDPDNIKYIPDDINTTELCELAMELGVSVFENISEKFITQKICDIYSKESFNNLSKIPDKFKTVEVCESSVNRKGCNLRYVPDETRVKLFKNDLKTNISMLGCIEDAEYINKKYKYFI